MKKPENNVNNGNNGKSAGIDVTFQVKRARVNVYNDTTFVTADIEINGVLIYGCRVVEGANGDFIGFPSRKGNDGKYYSHCYVNLSQASQSAILCEIERMINEQ